MEKKRHHYLFAVVILTMIVTSLFLAVPHSEEHFETRAISMEEEQIVISTLDHLGDTLPKQSLTLQNWMNKIDRGEVQLMVSDSKDSEIKFEDEAILIPTNFFQSDAISQQKSFSDALGMRFDYSKAAEIAFSRE